jgi:hypothetical protein
MNLITESAVAIIYNDSMSYKPPSDADTQVFDIGIMY